MRLHSDSEIAEMSGEDELTILQLGAGYSMQQYANMTVEDLLMKFEQSRNIWIWHDHSRVALHGILAVMVGVVYNSLVLTLRVKLGEMCMSTYCRGGDPHCCTWVICT